MYQDLSSKVMNIAFEKMEPVTKTFVSSCGSDQAWTDPRSRLYKKCTRDISATNGWIMGNWKNIENAASLNISSDESVDIKIGQIMEDLDPFNFNEEGFHEALRLIQNVSFLYETDLSCEQF